MLTTPDIVYFTDPFIYYYQNFASTEESQSLIELARNELTPSRVVGQDKFEVSNTRISEQVSFGHTSHELVYRISNRMAEIVKQPLNYAQNLQIVKYPKGGKFDAHLDTFSSQEPKGQEVLNIAGQRLYTALLYLNSVHAGGETFFPYLGLKIKPSEGSLVVFQNCKDGTAEPNFFSMHGSHPVLEGEKWIATLWFCERAHY
jgi:prolyl 4-hydroxylase